MKKAINIILSIFAPLAAVPTGWAIYAGVTKQPAFPMNPIAAGIGAVAIIIVGMAAALLIADAYYFSQSAQNKTEKRLSQPLWWSWAVLSVDILAEIVLSLLIVIFPGALAFGVLAFPIMTLAGAFAIAARIDLGQRENIRNLAREKAEQERLEKIAKAEKEKQERREEARKRREERKQEKKLAETSRKAARKPLKDADLLTFFAGNPGISDKQAAAHFGVSRQAIGQRRKRLYSVSEK